MNQKYRMTMHVGLVLRSRFRTLLDRYKFEGKLDRYFEDKGWLESEFIIKGADLEVAQHLNSLCRD